MSRYYEPPDCSYCCDAGTWPEAGIDSEELPCPKCRPAERAATMKKLREKRNAKPASAEDPYDRIKEERYTNGNHLVWSDKEYSWISRW